MVAVHEARLSVRFGGLCLQRSVRCLHHLDLGLDLPSEIPLPLGELGLTEHLEATFPGEHDKRDGAQPCLPFVCFYRFSQQSGISLLARLLLGEL